MSPLYAQTVLCLSSSCGCHLLSSQHCIDYNDERHVTRTQMSRESWCRYRDDVGVQHTDGQRERLLCVSTALILQSLVTLLNRSTEALSLHSVTHVLLTLQTSQLKTTTSSSPHTCITGRTLTSGAGGCLLRTAGFSRVFKEDFLLFRGVMLLEIHVMTW